MIKKIRVDNLSRRLAGQQVGGTIAELALVLPILFLVMLAIFWFGLTFYIYSTVERAAKQGVDALARQTCATCGNTVTADGAVLTSVTSVLQAGRLATTNLTTYAPPFACTAATAPNCRLSGPAVQICSGVPLTCGSSACQTPPAACGANPVLGTRVSFAYQYRFPVPVGVLQNITIPASAQVTQED